MTISADDLVLVLHDGARAAEKGKAPAGVLHDMADSLADLTAHRMRDDWDYRQDEIRAIRAIGSREA
jgi:hypothetical protein